MHTTRPLRVYLETSVWNFQYAEDAPDKQEITRQFFEEARRGKFTLYSSDVAVREIMAASEQRRSLLLRFFEQVGPTLLDISPEAVALSQEYVRSGVIPEKYANDGMHVAVATIEEMDILLSWNMRHIVKRKTRREVNGINLLAGYNEIEISTPGEVTTNDD